MEFSAQQIADFLKGEVVGNKDIKVNNFAKIEEGKSGTLTFLANPKYTHYIYETKSDIVLVNKTFQPEQSIEATLIKVDDAYKAISQLLQLVEQYKQHKTGVSEKIDVAKTAKIGENPYIASFVAIGNSTIIGDNVRIYANTTIGDNVTIGNNCIIYSNVSICDDTVIGDNCIIHSGAVIGADGFGFAPNANGTYSKIPQIGNIIIGDNVEIGANTTIDRATMGSTRIASGVKIDNLVQIAHNVEISENTVIAAQSGIAGSTKIGKHCTFAGQVGVAGHVSIADDTILAAQTGVNGSIKESGKIWQGTPVMPISTFQRSSVIIRKLPEIMRSINELEKSIKK